MIGEIWIFLAKSVHFKAFNQRESFFTATSALLFPQNAKNWYFEVNVRMTPCKNRNLKITPVTGCKILTSHAGLCQL